MELQIAGTNVEISPSVKSYAEKKLSRLSKHLPEIMDVKVEISEEKTRAPEQRFLVRVTVGSGVGAAFHGEERAEDPRKAIDGVFAIMVRQLERHKGKLYDRGRGNPLARGKASATTREAFDIKPERLVMEAMSPDEAVERLEADGKDFLLFVDPGSREVRLLYRRKDGGYGLVQPVFR